VGDNKQMPPTNWMKATIDFGDDEEEEIDAESILDLAQQRVGNSVSLRWHYRSRHPSLIRFSNNKFYDDKLEIFPTPTSSGTTLGLKGIKVEGRYKGQVNQIELEEVLVQAKQLMERYPDESLGIVAINRPQMELIKQALESSSDTVIRDFIDKWDSDPLNSVFVKNLDNVQGDERDNIIISTVYGKDEDGNLFQRFPSVASKNGHRRLNVLITRAKNRVILITSLNANDVKLNDDAPMGKRIFRDYIEYAMTGKLEAGLDLRQEADSDFEISVGEILKDAGYQVTPQVGVKGFRIDLGVSHEEFPNGYIAGIECDGAAFHSSASARDRDAIRQDILESLGWKIYRVWSTDWFANPSREREKMLQWLASTWQPKSQKPSESSKEKKPPEQAVSNKIFTTVFDDEERVKASPAGARGILKIDDQNVNYWKPIDGLYELWLDENLVGYTEELEVEVADATSSFAKRLAEKHVKYNSVILSPKQKSKTHDSFEIGLRWIYQESLKVQMSEG
ncbi:AAA domain-containing protein, partial [Candidatus Puniceispirillum sp.]|nr:AAA domain-containing protein [Candidatus Puniceispirillum sp.]